MSRILPSYRLDLPLSAMGIVFPCSPKVNGFWGNLTLAQNIAEGDRGFLIVAGGEGSQRLFDKPQASEVLFGPTSPYEEVTDHVGRESFASGVVVNEDPPPVRMLIDSLAAFALNKEKALALGRERTPVLYRKEVRDRA